MGVGPLFLIFPRLFQLASNEESPVKDYYVWNWDKVSWEVSVRRVLRLSESGEFESLSSNVNYLANVFLCRNSADKRISKPSFYLKIFI